MSTRLAISLVALAAFGACTRSVPTTFPVTSAASPDATAAPVATVGRALREDPPLPGEPTRGWEGLEPAAVEHRSHDHAH